jgi:hypothetical protein
MDMNRTPGLLLAGPGRPSSLQLSAKTDALFNRRSGGRVNVSSKDHAAHSIIKNGFIFKDPVDDSEHIKILCDESGIQTLLDAAEKLCPEATAEIERTISVPRMP